MLQELDLEGRPPASLAALEAYCDSTATSLIYTFLDALRVDDPRAEEAARCGQTHERVHLFTCAFNSHACVCVCHVCVEVCMRDCMCCDVTACCTHGTRYLGFLCVCVTTLPRNA